MFFNSNANKELTDTMRINAAHIKPLLIDEIHEFTGTPNTELSELINFTDVVHLGKTKTWYEFTSEHDFNIYATLDDNGFFVAVVEKEEFENYE